MDFKAGEFKGKSARRNKKKLTPAQVAAQEKEKKEQERIAFVQKETKIIAKAVIALQDCLNPSSRYNAPAWRPPIGKWKYPQRVTIHDNGAVRTYRGYFNDSPCYVMKTGEGEPDVELTRVKDIIMKMCPETFVVSDGAKSFIPVSMDITPEGKPVYTEPW